MRIRGPGAPTTALAERYDITPLSCCKTNTESSSAPPRSERTLAVTSFAEPNHSIAVEIKCGCKSRSCPPPSTADIFSRQDVAFTSGRNLSNRESIR